MTAEKLVSPDHIRSLFAQAMSHMYRTEVPLYGDLVELVSAINARVLAQDPELAASLKRNDDYERIDLERHGAIRVGTAADLVLAAQQVGGGDGSAAQGLAGSVDNIPLALQGLLLQQGSGHYAFLQLGKIF